MTTNNRHAEPWWHRGTNQNQPTRMGSAPTKPTSPAARLNSDNRRAQTTNNLVRRRVFRTLTLPPPAQPHPIHPAPIQPSDDDDQDSSPAETLHPPPTLTHQSHRAIPAQSQQCRAQRRRGVVPPEPSTPTAETWDERRGGESGSSTSKGGVDCQPATDSERGHLPLTSGHNN
mmetsp:Transcript_29656/g.61916  ORF Transcript_29656/g.61916 Transcript_29656/m.61916 type:complete len:173 (-) Transcript_29656:209-727(-)